MKLYNKNGEIENKTLTKLGTGTTFSNMALPLVICLDHHYEMALKGL